MLSRLCLRRYPRHLTSRAVARLKSLQNSGAFRVLWVLLTKTEKFCATVKKNGDIGSFFLGAFDKYVESLCYFGDFQRFGSIQRLFGAFLTYFENSTEILGNFLKTPGFGKSPEIREPGTAHVTSRVSAG